MKIAILHMTMGKVFRGSEKTLDVYAKYLSKNHEVMVFQAGSITSKHYQTKIIGSLDQVPVSAPVSLKDKVMFRLGMDDNSRKVLQFTKDSLIELTSFSPDLIIPVNGANQQRLIKFHFPDTPQLVFGSAGMGYHDYKALKAKPDVFIALSASAFEWAKSKSSDVLLRLLPNPMNLKEFQPATPAKQGSLPVVLTVGALTKYKQIDLVIKAVSQTPFSLLIVGDGEEKANLMSLAQKLMPGRYVFKEARPEEMPGIYASAQLFCFLPQPQEAFGNVLLEAMASGLPLITSDDPVRRSIVGENGFFVDPKDTPTITKLLLQSPSLVPVDYGQTLKKYSIEVIGPQLERIISEIT